MNILYILKLELIDAHDMLSFEYAHFKLDMYLYVRNHHTYEASFYIRCTHLCCVSQPPLLVDQTQPLQNVQKVNKTHPRLGLETLCWQLL